MYLSATFAVVFFLKLQVAAIDFSACHQNSSNVGDSPDFAEVTQKISAFTSNVTDLSFVYRAKEGERKSCDPAIRWNIRRNTSRTVSERGVGRGRDVAEGDAVKRSANNARERPLCGPKVRGVEASHSIASNAPYVAIASPPTPAKGWLHALTRLPSLQHGEGSKEHQRKSRTPAPPEPAAPPFDLREIAKGLETIMPTNSCVCKNRFAEIAPGWKDSFARVEGWGRASTDFLI